MNCCNCWWSTARRSAIGCIDFRRPSSGCPADTARPWPADPAGPVGRTRPRRSAPTDLDTQQVSQPSYNSTDVPPQATNVEENLGRVRNKTLPDRPRTHEETVRDGQEHTVKPSSSRRWPQSPGPPASRLYRRATSREEGGTILSPRRSPLPCGASAGSWPALTIRLSSSTKTTWGFMSRASSSDTCA